MKNQQSFAGGMREELVKPDFWSDILKAALKAAVTAVVMCGVNRALKARR